MSHLKERSQKNCLNCNAQVYGRFCHICGQENLEPAESIWHLITHFFNDITHFDGKFFSSLKLLVFKPGFLSAEYKMGRRHSYLNPVRMYVFTSFLFFLLFFSVYHFDDNKINFSPKTTVFGAIAASDSTSYRGFTDAVKSMDSQQVFSFSRAVNLGKPLSRKAILTQVDSLRAKRQNYTLRNAAALYLLGRLGSVNRHYFYQEINLMDSATFDKFSRALNGGKSFDRNYLTGYMDSVRSTRFVSMSKKYRNLAEYDSLKKAGTLKENWITRKFYEKGYDLNERNADKAEQFTTNLVNTLFHYFPQMLFLSLPLFALFLQLIYFRHKEHYLVSHGIYSVHIYIFYFIMLLLMIGLNKLSGALHWGWLNTVSALLFLVIFFYEYKAMRYYYGQRRGKTILKFLLAGTFRFFLILVLFIVFLLITFFKV